MQVVVLAEAVQREELLRQGQPRMGIVFVNEESDLLNHTEADAFVDLMFINEADRIALLEQLLPKPVIINSVADTLGSINGWNTFLASPLIEATCKNEESKSKAEEVFALFNKRLQWLDDEPGFITARVVSMIINEAFITLVEGVSTKDEIDTAMKLGTAYPYGPFEWAEKIGLKNIVALLQKLSETQPRYRPSECLVRETLGG